MGTKSVTCNGTIFVVLKFRLCVYTVIVCSQGKRGVGESLQLMTGLVSMVQHQSLPYIPLHVSDVLLTLHRPDNIELWDPRDSLSAFWEISNQVSCTI